MKALSVMRMPAVLLLAFGVLTGCSSNGEEQRLWSEVGARVVPGAARGSVPTARYIALQNAGAATMIAESESWDEAVMLRKLGRSADGVVTWLAPDGSGFSFRSGVLVETRGVGNDLMSSDVAQTLTRLESGQQGAVERFHGYLNGDNQIVLRSYVCAITRNINQPESSMQEECNGTDEQFTNYYLFRQDGTIMQSLQWISGRAGSVLFRNETAS